MDAKRLCIDGPCAGISLTASGVMLVPSGKDKFIKYHPVELTLEDGENIDLWVAGERSLGRIVECLHDIVDLQ